MMTARFHEGQEVEVAQDFLRNDGIAPRNWREAKIVDADQRIENEYIVQFPDGTRAVFDADHIRERFPLDNHQMRFGSSPVVWP